MSDTKKRSTSPRSSATGKRKKKKSAHSKARKRAAPVREDVEIDILGANKSSETLHAAAAEVDLLDGGAQPRSKVTSAALEELTGAAPLASANFEQRTARALSGEARAETGDDERVAQAKRFVVRCAYRFLSTDGEEERAWLAQYRAAPMMQYFTASTSVAAFIDQPVVEAMMCAAADIAQSEHARLLAQGRGFEDTDELGKALWFIVCHRIAQVNGDLGRDP